MYNRVLSKSQIIKKKHEKVTLKWLFTNFNRLREMHLQC